MKNLLLFLFIFKAFLSFSQTDSRDNEYMYERKKYLETISILEPIYQTKPSQKIAVELADAFFYARKFEKALMYYEMALHSAPINEKQTENYFSALYEYGDIDLAKKVAEEYQVKYGKKDLVLKLDSANRMQLQDPTYFETNLAINTADNEYGFISLVNGTKLINCDINLNNGESRIFSPYSIEYSNPETPVSKYNLIGVKDDKYHDVITYYDEKESKVYITRSSMGKYNYPVLKIIIATINEDMSLTEMVEFPYNSEEYSVGHVSVSKDGEILYFVSDKPGGYGGTDIYRCMKLENGTWGFPINIGNNVNTKGDEMYPYISPQGNTLYFSSTGHSIFGGLDLNKAQKTRAHAFKKPENLGLPFNSNKDDFGIVFNDNYGTEGYFCSNRTEGKGGDDIYFFSYHNNKVCKDPVKNFKMTVVDKKTKARIPNVKLKMTVKLDGKVYEDISDDNGEVHLTVEGCNDFDVESTHDFYLNNLFYYDGFRKQVTIELDKKELNNIIELESIYYEKGKFEVPANATSQLNKLAILLNKNTDVKIELSSHTDSRADDVFNQTLSQKRAEHIVNYLTKAGVKRSQLVAQGYGESKLINECGNDVPCSEEMHEKNRRTEFKILEIAK
mgnify:CR=1 FL=1